MLTIKDLIKDWIEMRATLKRHLEVLEFDATTSAANASTEAAIVMIKSCISELNTLLKEYARAQGP
jgi:hypothetical protein